MALSNPQAHYPIRHPNKEPEWSRICNNVFDQYLDANDLFGFGSDDHERNSSDDSINLFNFSGSSEQSHETEATSSIHSLGTVFHGATEVTPQPQAKESATFWKATLKALEQNAVASERNQRGLRSTKSHPDFLSLGGYPSPPAIPSSPTNQYSFGQQRLPRPAQSEKRRNTTARSLSRGRPTGVAKSAVTVHPYSTTRQFIASPPKMMNPSRYRAGFKDIWLEKLERSPKKYELRRPSSPLFCTPPPSAKASYDGEFNTFPPISVEPFRSVFDEHMSPLTTTFQRTHINTPTASPRGNYSIQATGPYFEPLHQFSSVPYTPQTMLLDDTAPFYPDRTSALTASRIQSFDFGFPSSLGADLWANGVDSRTSNPLHSTNQSDLYQALDTIVLPTTETFDFNTVGLGISCDPSLVSNIPPSVHNTLLPSSTTSRPAWMEKSPHGLSNNPNGLLNTPHRRSRSCFRSGSPSPPATEPRSSRKASSSRKPSKHRRAKSTNSTPRHPQSLDKAAFVNFTAEDSGKILNGVAPSGSSKTKARREREAADKRRRLSQAAIQAVFDAGGDLDALSKSGLLA